MPELSELIEADAEARRELIRAAAPAELEATVAQLGHLRDPRAAEVLSLVDQLAEDRHVRKAARRELHRLRSAGVDVPAPVAVAEAPPPAPASRAPEAQITQAWASDIDPSGGRALWLLAERSLGGAAFGAALLNDLNGLEELSVLDTTRKRFQRELADTRQQGTWVSLPGDYALRLVREAVDLTRERHQALPARYVRFHEVFGEADGPPARALIYETISPVEATFHPEWLEDSARLLGEPETRYWFVAVPHDFQARALEVARSPSVPLLVPGNTPEQRALQLVADAARATITPEVRRGLRRRLEETAYLFLSTDRLPAARLAVAAAHALEDAHLPPERQPLVRLLLSAGLARLVASEAVGSRRASEALLELVERAFEQERQAGPGALESRPSGLILPR